MGVLIPREVYVLEAREVLRLRGMQELVDRGLDLFLGLGELTVDPIHGPCGADEPVRLRDIAAPT